MEQQRFALENTEEHQGFDKVVLTPLVHTGQKGA
jgi:hypothetical protein